jgi:hypothetical protein
MPDLDPKIFKDVCNRWRTQSLFEETNEHEDKYPSIFLLKEDKDRDGLTSMKRIYMEQADPTEYRAAMAMFGCWEPWENLCNTEFFQTELKKWRRELAIKLRSDATQAIISAGKGAALTSTQLTAAKWVAEHGWLNVLRNAGDDPNVVQKNKEGGDPLSTARSPGRPSKAAISLEAERKFREELKRAEEAAGDAKRLGI